MLADVEKKRNELIHLIADVDDEVGDLFLSEEAIPSDVLVSAIRRATVARKFVPVFMGSAFKNKGHACLHHRVTTTECRVLQGVQVLLDGVQDFLPSPTDVKNVALDVDNDEEPIGHTLSLTL